MLGNDRIVPDKDSEDAMDEREYAQDSEAGIQINLLRQGMERAALQDRDRFVMEKELRKAGVKK